MKSQQSYAASLEDIRAAAERIKGHAHRTPVHRCKTLDELSGRRLFFKCENFQRVGAFKFRGAYNTIAQLPTHLALNGVVTHSSGNHAQAVALAARICEVTAHIVMPSDAPAVKRRAVEGYGGIIHTCAPNLQAREDTANAVAKETGATMIPPYDHPQVIAGQGTVGLELFEAVPNLDAVCIPVGGGGLLSGIALALRELNPALRIFAAEPAGADDAARSKAAGRLIPQTAPNTIADGLKTSLGQHTWPVVRDLVEDIFVVDDKAIEAAMFLIWERMKLVVEPSAAVAPAVVLGEPFKALGGIERVGLVLCGGNLDLTALPWMRQESHHRGNALR